MEIKDKLYGILMDTSLISENVLVYIPSYAIEGEYDNYFDEELDEKDNQLFVDKLGNPFFVMGSSEDLNSEKVVGFVISEKNLIDKYPGYNSIDLALSKYYEEISAIDHFGVYDNDGNVNIISTNLGKVLSGDLDNIKLVSEVSNVNGVEVTKKNIDFPIKNSSILLGIDEFKSICFAKDYKEMKHKLKDILDLYDEGKKNVEELENKSKIYKILKDIFNKNYDELLEIDDLDLIKKRIEETKEKYIKVFLKIESVQKDKDLVLKYEKFLTDAYDNLETVSKINNLDGIKRGISSLKISDNNKSLALPKKDLEEQKQNDKKDIDINIKDMKTFLDQSIIGQEEAKRDVISTIAMNKKTNSSRNRTSCLLIGPTGSGKTLIVEEASKYLKIPMEIIDSTQLTMPGYIGANIEDYLEKLLMKADGNIEKAEHGIVVFDEIDKKGSNSNSDVSGKGVLNTLLTFIQGTTYNVPYGGRDKKVSFDTSKLTIFATGSFTSVLSKLKNQIYSGNSIGFFNSTDSKKDKQDIKYFKMSIDDLEKYGDVPRELLGRITSITQLSGHTKESLKEILTNSNNSPLKAEKNKLDNSSIELLWSDKYPDSVAEEALKLKTGARSLKSIVEKSIKNLRWEALLNQDLYCGIVLTPESVTDNNQGYLIDKDGNFHQLGDIIKAKDETSLMIVDNPKIYKKEII